MSDLPIEAVLDDVVRAVRDTGRCVLQAPPGAGKTSRVPLALSDAGFDGKIVMLEPRRLAARAAAERLAEQLGEKVGDTIGYRMRGDSVSGQKIEVVTEGILTRMLQSDPELAGIGTLIFDEFHERSLNADLGLALAWEVRQALRPDLRIVVMSATLDAKPVARLLDDAPIITSEGRAFLVTDRWLPRPLPKTRRRLGEITADLVREALADTQGGVLVFLPGAREIGDCASALAKGLPDGCVIRPLYGAMPFADQRKAIRPDPTARKIVLATNIAETSLTIEDVRVVVDSGKTRRARFDPRSGMSRLVTEAVSKAEAKQRAGRAGRVAEGVCYKLWAKAENGALPAFPPAEIETADLTGLALDLAEWGAEPSDLAFLTQPPATALTDARELLALLGALKEERLTDHGKQLAKMPLHPRVAHMLAIAGPDARYVAALLAGRDILDTRQSDLAFRIRALTGGATPRGADKVREEAKRLGKLVKAGRQMSVGQQVALAYPDRVGLRRKGDDARYILSGGRGAALENDDELAAQRLIVACDLDGDAREARIRLAAPLTEAELRELYDDRIAWHGVCEWSKRDARVIARQQERCGACVLQDRIWTDAPEDAQAKAMLSGIRQLGLRFSPAAERFRARVSLVDGLSAMDDDTLLETLESWLLPHLGPVRSAADWKTFDALPALRAMLDWDQMQRLDAVAPAHFETPLGRKIPIDYGGDAPEITLRLQEMFGQTTHPHVGRTPLRVTLLSPGQKPVQTTQDLPNFWATSYADVRKDMRGRYPKHPWPEDPTVADPTLRAKPRTR